MRRTRDHSTTGQGDVEASGRQLGLGKKLADALVGGPERRLDLGLHLIDQLANLGALLGGQIFEPGERQA
jgi:hypothetical protein